VIAEISAQARFVVAATMSEIARKFDGFLSDWQCGQTGQESTVGNSAQHSEPRRFPSTIAKTLPDFTFLIWVSDRLS
jgi:hypothetical protein